MSPAPLVWRRPSRRNARYVDDLSGSSDPCALCTAFEGDCTHALFEKPVYNLSLGVPVDEGGRLMREARRDDVDVGQ